MAERAASDLWIPRRVSEVDAGWVGACLAASDFGSRAAVHSLRVEPLGTGRGFMGDTYRLHLGGESDGPASPGSLILKLPARQRATRARAELLGFYEREILFYTEVAGALPIAPPRCYHAAMDPNPSGPDSTREVEAKLLAMGPWRLRALLGLGHLLVRLSRRRYVLLLEDLGAGVPGDQLRGESPRVLSGVLLELARMQAACWESSSITSLSWLPRLESGAHLARAWYRRSRVAFRRRYGKLVPASVQVLLEDIDRGLEGLLASLSRTPGTLLHGDLRLDNLVFDERGGESRVRFLDWQVPCWGAGVYDVAYLLGSSLDAEVSRDEERELLRGYHRALFEQGVRGYSFDDCLADYGRCLLLALHRMVGSVISVDLQDPRGEVLMRTWLQRMVACIQRAGGDAWARALAPTSMRDPTPQPGLGG